MPVAAAASGASLVGNLVGGGKAASAQNNATNQAAAQQQQVMQLINNYVSSVSPAVSQMVQGLLSGSNPISQAITGALGNLTSTAGAAANFGTSAPNTTLENYNGLKPAELQALTTNAAASGMSDIATAESQGAFGANQNAAISNALQKNQQAAESAAVNVGSNAASSEEQAQSAAASNALGGLQTATSGYGAAGNTGVNQLNATNQGVTSSLNLLNPNSSGAQPLTQLATGNQNTASSYGNPYGPAANSAGQVLSNLGGNGGSTATNNSLLSMLYGPGGSAGAPNLSLLPTTQPDLPQLSP